jgi:hypothetical protein
LPRLEVGFAGRMSPSRSRSQRAIEEKERDMKARAHILTFAVAATAAIGAQAAQAHQLRYVGKQAEGKSVRTQSALSVMTQAGIHYRADANLRNEKNLVGGATGAKSSQTHVRPDDRLGPREA